MSFRLSVPASTTLLPNPEFGDSEGHNVSVNYMEAINGKPYAYKKTTGYRNIEYTWSNLGRGKIEEIIEFFKLYIGQMVTIEDHNGSIFHAVLTSDGISATTEVRSAPLTEAGSLTLRFSGVKL